jgi:hypothetical protein
MGANNKFSPAPSNTMLQLSSSPPPKPSLSSSHSFSPACKMHFLCLSPFESIQEEEFPIFLQLPPIPRIRATNCKARARPTPIALINLPNWNRRYKRRKACTRFVFFSQSTEKGISYPLYQTKQGGAPPQGTWLSSWSSSYRRRKNRPSFVYSPYQSLSRTRTR